ncbi:DUF5693 family protein [Deinococcus aquiradiocola]|uniref:Uncharacterized protein n=1 Tax=Deinococcus aquiradiocola TaxID=393059 RepID=A0A917PLQ4_9DEIO|nr:DUF5693 family protein [Deinococcus aquiradiocola]GGJ83321.1 hypothetical protein GCM10008939_29020 [Deinococcus aquiradiocola]
MTPTTPPASRNPLLPTPNRHPLTPVLLLLIALSLIPALILAFTRVQFEQAQKTVSIVMDYSSLSAQANLNGQTPLGLLGQYRALGVNGVAVYEDTVGSKVARGELYLKPGSELAVENPGANVNTQLTYTRDLKPGTTAALKARFNLKFTDVTVGGQRWTAWPTDISFLPAGPNTTLISALKAQGYVVVYRPYDSPVVKVPGSDWPDVPFLAFNDTEVIGARDPELMRQVRARLGNRVPAIIEFTPQKGLDQLIAGGKAVRLFSISAAWQDLLTPPEVSSKFVLAARERSHKLLYTRPFKTVNDTTTFLKDLKTGLDKWGIRVGTPVAAAYEPNLLLKWLCIVGPLAAILLIGLSYPLTRVGLGVAVIGLLIALGLNGGQPFPGFALVAAISFPALGLVMRRDRVTDWFVATGFSLAGVLFVSALGANRDSMLGLDPFKGVGLTLLFPILLVALSFLPRQDIRKTVYQIYTAPIKLGDIIVMVLGAAAFALVFLRRGNATGVGVSDAEAKVRQSLQDSIIRPRFKELAGHPLLLLGLSGILPGYFTLLMLLGGVIGQASILNTFSHFHTPLLISFQRAFIGLGAGLVLGYVALYAVKFAMRLWQGRGDWLRSGTLN